MIPRPGDAAHVGYYVCDGRRYRGKGFCDQPFLRQDVVDKAMLDELSRRYLDFEVIRERLAVKMAADSTIASEGLQLS